MDAYGKQMGAYDGGWDGYIWMHMGASDAPLNK